MYEDELQVCSGFRGVCRLCSDVAGEVLKNVLLLFLFARNLTNHNIRRLFLLLTVIELDHA